MSIEPTKQPTRFTYDPPTKEDYLKLVFAGPRTYCQVMTYKQCKGEIKDTALREKCMALFLECLEEARRFERWSRMN